VIKLLSEMEMLDENGEDLDMEEREQSVGEEVGLNSIIRELPDEFLQSAQEMVSDFQVAEEKGYVIHDAGDQSRDKVGRKEVTGEPSNHDQRRPVREGGRKTKWGPVVAERKSNMISNDGRTFMEKAQEN
jgi:hypothetical protein